MSGKTNKLIIQEISKDYGEEAAEGTKVLSQGDDKFDGADEEFEEARVEENALDAGRAEESVARARSQRARNMARYVMGTVNDPKEEEEENNAEGNRKQPATNPVGEVTSGQKKPRQLHDQKGRGNWLGMQWG